MRPFVLSALIVVAAHLPAHATSPRECSGDADCNMTCQKQVDALRAPAAAPSPFAGSECVVVSFAVPASGCAGSPGASQTPRPPVTGCACYIDQRGGSYYFVSATSDAHDGCDHRSRGGDCLYKPAEFPGCKVDAAASCTAVCDDLQRRREADAKKVFDASLLGAVCSGSGFCRCVLQIGTTCTLDGRAYDCALGARGIVGEADRLSRVESGGCSVSGRGSRWTFAALLLVAMVALARGLGRNRARRR